MKLFSKEFFIKNKKKLIYIGLSITFLTALIVVIHAVKSNNIEQYIMKNGEIELSELATAFIIKDEQVVQRNNGKSILPALSEGERVASGGIIATYKTDEYTKYIETLEEMDTEIMNLMKDLPSVYSGEIQSIENQLKSEIKSCVGETSYVSMQGYLNTVNSLINKRALIIGESSPTGSAVQSLIVKRNKYAQEGQKSNDNIISPCSGMVSYKTDGLENILTIANTDKYDYSAIQEMVNNHSASNNIKIVNNFLAYIVLNVPSYNKANVSQDATYKLRMIDGNHEFKAKLISIIEDGEILELKFKITNGIEHLINTRETQFEVVWWSKSGWCVPNEAVYKYDERNAYYVKTIKYGQYVNIPVIVSAQNDKYSIIDNMSSDMMEQYGLSRQYSLKLYDRLVIER